MLLNPTSLIERAVRAIGHAKVMDGLSAKEREHLVYSWRCWARDNQLPPPCDWLVWLLLAGRGFGKTRTVTEFGRAEVEAGRAGRIALVAQTPADVRDVLIEGECGLLAVCPPWNMPKYEPSKRRLTWPNGAMATAYSSHEPDQLRGPQHDLALCDEIRTWAYPTETWDNLMFGLRLGSNPRAVAATTPSPIALIRNLLKNPETVVTRGTTYENRANLAPAFYRQIVAQYEGTRLGQQEIYAELLEDVPGALWKRSYFKYQPAPPLARIILAIDPAVTSGESADETGIVVAGCTGGPFAERRYWVLADCSLRATPLGWASLAVQAYREYRADRIIGEVNNGGEMVELTLRTVSPIIPYTAVHASRGKYIRAEPVAALYEQGRVSHVKPFIELEDQCCTWTSDVKESPDRLDALVWALAHLSQPDEPGEGIIIYDAMVEVGSMDL